MNRRAIAHDWLFCVATGRLAAPHPTLHNTMARETELKLLLAPSDLPGLLGHPLLAAEKPVRQRLVNTYYDTSDHQLRQNRMAVRERRAGRRLLLTVKTAGTTVGGLSRRGEWEAPTRAGEFDFAALVDDTELAAWLAQRRADLRPVFRTDFQRHAWTVRHGGATVEIALDEGEICTGTAGRPVAHPLLELELELLDGPPDALHQTARALLSAAPLFPCATSKAERAYALAQSPDQTATPAGAVAAHGDTPVAAFVSVAQPSLAALQSNLHALHAGVQDPELVHQARVALRRLRAALRVFAPALDPAWVQHWTAQWRTLGAWLGPVRDADVQALEVWPLLAESGATWPARLVRADAAARRLLLRRLAEPTSVAGPLLAFGQALGELPDSRLPASERRLRRFARERLEGRRQRLVRSLAAVRPHDAPSLHALRIEVKKARYALDMLGALVSPRRARALARWMPVLVRAQSVLGHFNDLCLARERLAPAAGSGLDRVLARHEDRVHRRMGRMLRQLREALGEAL